MVTELPIAPEHRGLDAAQDTIMWFETVRALAYERIEHSAELSPRLAQLIDTGMAIGAEVYERRSPTPRRRGPGSARSLARAMRFWLPAAPGEAPAGLGNTGNPVFNRMWTLLGVPCVAVPARWAENGLPTAVQLVGRARDDARLMACAVFLEQALAEAA